MARHNNISAWNSKIDHTVQRIGLNGIWYDYLMPRGANDLLYYKEALDVRSRKSSDSHYKNGKKPGQYQPVGAKKYFTFYQLKHNKEELDDIWKLVIDETSKIVKHGVK